MSSIAPYLVSTPTSIFFRLTIPVDLRPLFGKRELKKSLAEHSLGEAREIALSLAGQFQRLFRTPRDDTAKMPAEQKNLTPQLIQEIVSQVYQDGLQSMDEYFSLGIRMTPDEVEEKQEIIASLEADDREALATGDFQHIGKRLQPILEERGITVDRKSPEFRQLCKEALVVQTHLSREEQRRIVGDYTASPLPSYLVQPQAVPVTPQASTEREQRATVEQVYEMLRDESLRSGQWKASTVKEYNSLQKTMAYILGADTEIHTISKARMVQFKEFLQKVPSGFLKTNRYKGLSPDEVVKAAPEGTRRLSVERINDYIARASKLFDYAASHGYMDENTAKGLKINNSKQRKRADQQRDIFATEDLRRIFHHEDFRNDAFPFKRSFMFWLPLLGLFTGARLNEISQLRLEDLGFTDGLFCLSFRESVEAGQSLKNAQSVRTIPVHPFLVENLKLPEYVETLKTMGETMLFPDVKPQGGSYGHYTGKEWNRWRTSKLELLEGKKSFHSFRHTFITHLKDKLVHDVALKEFVGHAIEGETYGRYGKRLSPSVLFDEIVSKIDYGVDLSQLENSRFVVGSERWGMK